MVDSDQLALLGIIGGGYLLFTEVSDTLLGPPEWMNEDAEEVDQDIQKEAETPDQISDLEYQQHIIYYREQYTSYYETVDGENKEGIRSPEVVQEDIENKDLTLREEAFAWKAAANAVINITRDEEGGFNFDLPPGLKWAVGLTLGAISAGAVGNLGKKMHDWATDNEGDADAKGAAMFGDPDFIDDYYGTGAPQVVDTVWGEPEPLPETVLEPIPEESGDPVIEGTPSGTIDFLPDWVVDAVYSVLDIVSDDVITVSQEALEIIAEVTGSSVSWLIDNPDVALVLAIVMLLIAYAATSPEPVTSALGIKAATYMAGAVGVTISVSAAKSRASEFQEAVQVG